MSEYIANTAGSTGVGLTPGYRVVITGAAGVIGGWIADEFSRHGASLFLSDQRVEPLESDLAAGRWSGSSVHIHRADLCSPESVEELVRVVADRFEAPDALINNAGIYPHAALLDVTRGDWDAVIGTNLTAPFLLTQRIAGLMIHNAVSGSIVNIASGAALTVSPGGTPYSVSKAALVMLTRGSALELAPYRIRVNAVGPGFAPGSSVSPLDPEYVTTMASTIPLGRTSGPGDTPAFVVYLCSQAADFITGTFMNIDGGRTAGPVMR
jgi:3-oxoacyl-[acyl-carrier protein] reductase